MHKHTHPYLVSLVILEICIDIVRASLFVEQLVKAWIGGHGHAKATKPDEDAAACLAQVRQRRRRKHRWVTRPGPSLPVAAKSAQMSEN